MRTALTVITTAILTAIAFLFAWQEGRLGTSALSGAAVASCPTPSTETGTADDGTCLSVEEGASCTAPWGDQVLHGEAILSFEQEIASGDISCDGRTSICDDGVWLNEVSPFAFTTCSYGDGVGISVVENNCAVGGVMVPHDSTNTFYKEKKNGSTYTYEAQKRYCFDGQLDGDAAYNKLNLISSCTLEIKEEVVVEIPQPVVQPVRAPVVTQPQEPVYARCTGPFGGVWQHGQ